YLFLLFAVQIIGQVAEDDLVERLVAHQILAKDRFSSLRSRLSENRCRPSRGVAPLALTRTGAGGGRGRTPPWLRAGAWRPRRRFLLAQQVCWSGREVPRGSRCGFRFVKHCSSLESVHVQRQLLGLARCDVRVASGTLAGACRRPRRGLWTGNS